MNEVQEISKIAVSYMGYTTYADTIKPGQSIEIHLNPKVLNMDEVVVTAQYTPERADKSIYKVEVINSRQIEQKAATNMADLLKDQSSMRVTQEGVLGTSLRIQGMSGENVKFLQDGVPLIGRMNCGVAGPAEPTRIACCCFQTIRQADFGYVRNNVRDVVLILTYGTVIHEVKLCIGAVGVHNDQACDLYFCWE